MTTFLQWCGRLFFVTLFGNCGPTDHPSHPAYVSNPSPEAPSLVRYLSDARDSVQVSLILRADSTFVLRTITPRGTELLALSGALKVTETRYRLFFPDTLTHFNELIAPVHADASVVAYPDYSVMLDKKLRQLYVLGTLVTADSLPQP